MKCDVLTSFWGSKSRGKFCAASYVVQMAFCRDWDNRPHFAVCPPVQGRKTFQKCPCAPQKFSSKRCVFKQTRLLATFRVSIQFSETRATDHWTEIEKKEAPLLVLSGAKIVIKTISTILLFVER